MMPLAVYSWPSVFHALLRLRRRGARRRGRAQGEEQLLSAVAVVRSSKKTMDSTRTLCSIQMNPSTASAGNLPNASYHTNQVRWRILKIQNEINPYVLCCFHIGGYLLAAWWPVRTPTVPLSGFISSAWDWRLRWGIQHVLTMTRPLHWRSSCAFTYT